jgi:4-amino-4-deoxy-L-arabinose transferase-like glycosyltransferase
MVIIESSKLFRFGALVLLCLLLLARLFGMAIVPLMDTTEARYGEIGRKMAELNDWVTPWFDYGVPYWGKPPLSFWLTAISFRLFGINEFTARLPHLIFALAIIGLVVWLAGRRDRDAALPAAALISGSFLYFVSAGAVMTDIELVLGTTLAMGGFWLALEQHGPGIEFRAGRFSRTLAGTLFFGGLVIGLLAKGPVALVLIAAPLFLWIAYNHRWREAWRDLPWVQGLGLTLLVCVPWYWIAEQHTPGFLRYFLLGEHWHRFVTPGWHGDLYGSAHRFPIGTIWAFAMLDTLPWSILLPIAAWRWHKSRVSSQLAPASTAGNSSVLEKNGLREAATGRSCSGSSDERSWQSYLLFWSLTPLLFFTAARNIIMTYVLPALPAAVILGGGWLAAQARKGHHTNRLLCAGLFYTLLTAATFAMVDLHQPEKMEHKSVKALLEAYDQDRSAEPSSSAAHKGETLIFFVWFRPFSAEFYSHGRAIKVNDDNEVWRRIGTSSAYVATFSGDAFIRSASSQKRQVMASPQTSLASVATSGRPVERLGHYGDFDLLFVPAVE